MMHFDRRTRVVTCTALLTLITSACEPSTVPTTGRIRSITADWTAPASAAVGSALASPLQVRVTDENGRAVAGQRVVFSVTRGIGSIQIPDTVTGANGIASAGTWTLGSAAGTQEVTAHLPAQSSDERVVFSVLTVPGAPATMTLSASALSLTSGDSSRVTVTFRDAFNNVTTSTAPSAQVSLDTTVVRVLPNGFLRAVARGIAGITITNGTVSRSAWVGVRSGAPVLTVEQVTGPAGDLLSINGARTAYVASTSGNSVTRFDLATRTATGSVTLTAPLMDLAFLPSGNVLYAATSDSTVHLIDVTANILMRSFRTPARVNRLSPTPDGLWLLATTNSNAGAVLKISSVNDAMTTATVSGTQRAFALSSDGARSYVVSSNSQVHEVRTEPFAFVRSALISVSGQWIDVASTGGRLLIAALSDSLDMRHPSDLARMRTASPGAAILQLADTPDGHYLITIASGSPQVRISDAYTLESYASQAAISPGRIAFDNVAHEAWIASSAGSLLRLVIMPPP